MLKVASRDFHPAGGSKTAAGPAVAAAEGSGEGAVVCAPTGPALMSAKQNAVTKRIVGIAAIILTRSRVPS